MGRLYLAFLCGPLLIRVTLVVSGRVPVMTCFAPFVCVACAARVCFPGDATTTMQGNYAGVAPFLISPVLGLSKYASVTYEKGCDIACNDTAGFAGNNSVVACEWGYGEGGDTRLCRSRRQLSHMPLFHVAVASLCC